LVYNSGMNYNVIFTEECHKWFYSLPESTRGAVYGYVEMLETYGPHLGFPYSSQIQGSVYNHLRELRVQHRGEPYRILYAFDPMRSAILLVGGNKTSDGRWYKKHISLAEKFYQQHLEKSRGNKK